MVPIRRKFLPTDPFFQDGDKHCYSSVKQLAEQLEDLAFHHKREELTCSIANCNRTFSSITSFENHYNCTHRNICNHCKRNFPSARFLEIHVLESHDTLFHMLCQRQNMFECLVDGCDEKFATSDIRLQHLIKIHQYPKNFRFANKITVKKKQKENIQIKNAMDIEEDSVSNRKLSDSISSIASQDTTKANDKIPKQFSFGRGKGRGFQKASSGRKRGRKKKEKYNQDHENMEM